MPHAHYRITYKNEDQDPSTGYLSAHGTVDGDARGGDSTFVHVNDTHYGDVWDLEDIEGKPCTYKIKLSDQANGANGVYLSSHRTVDGDVRSGDSTYVSVNSGYYGDEWTLEPVIGSNPPKYYIHLTKSDHGAVGTYLNVHKTVEDKDVRGGDSTYVHVNEQNYKSYWEFEKV